MLLLLRFRLDLYLVIDSGDAARSVSLGDVESVRVHPEAELLQLLVVAVKLSRVRFAPPVEYDEHVRVARGNTIERLLLFCRSRAIALFRLRVGGGLAVSGSLLPSIGRARAGEAHDNREHGKRGEDVLLEHVSSLAQRLASAKRV